MSGKVKVIQGVGQAATTATIMVSSSEDCESLSEKFPIGSMAMKADLSFVAQKGLDGEWVTIIEDEGGEE